MSVVSVTTQNQILDAWLGTGRAAGTEDTYDLELWAGDPRGTGVEVSGGDYAAQSVDADDFGPAVGGQTSATGFTDFPTVPSEVDPDDEGYSAVVTHYVLRDTSTSEIAFCAPLSEPLDVSSAGDGPRVKPIVFFAVTT